MHLVPLSWGRGGREGPGGPSEARRSGCRAWKAGLPQSQRAEGRSVGVEEGITEGGLVWNPSCYELVRT